MFLKNIKKPALLDWPVKKEWKQDCTHVDHTHLDTLYHMTHTHQHSDKTVPM